MEDRNVLPDKEKWEFNEEVTACFDDMLRRSIPQYDVMRDRVTLLAERFCKKNTDIVDLGCSRGDALAPIIDKRGAYNRYVGIDVSDSMIDFCRKRFKGYIDTGIVKIDKCDLRNEFPPCQASVILSVLTLQFVPIEYRFEVLRQCYDSLVPGGVLIFVEKILGRDAITNEILVSEYLKFKRLNGYSEDEINRKRSQLEGVLVPLTSSWNESMLLSAGFNKIERFWLYLNFAGWIAIK